jgi:hypothetical protein
VIVLISLPLPAESSTPQKHFELLLDRTAEENLITSRVLKELSGLSTTHRTKEGESRFRALGVHFQVAGVVRVAWSFRTVPDQSYNMDCYVVEDDEAEFDIIAGQAYLEDNPQLQELVRPKNQHDAPRAMLRWRHARSKP